jgi:excisionase family DNA binding protein
MTQNEAARVLGASWRLLVQLLESGELASHRAGQRRRLLARDVLAYKTRRDVARREVLDRLASAEAAEGLYDLEPPTDHQM